MTQTRGKECGFGLWLVLVAAASAAAGGGSEPITIEAYLGRTTVAEPALSPDGESVVFTVGEKATWDGSRRTSLWLIPSDGGKRRRLTNPAGPSASDWGPQWSPDGARVAFLSSRTAPPQVWAIAVDGGEAMPVTSAERGVDAFRWLGPGEIAFVSAEPRDPGLVEAEAAAGGGYEAGTTATTSALWRQPVDDPGGAQRVTDGARYIAAFAAAPAGAAFALVTAASSDLYDVITDSELRLVDGAGATLWTDRPGRALADPELSPDGTRLSVVAATVGFSAADGLFIYDVAGPPGRNLTGAFDPTILDSSWPDDDTVAFTSLEGTSTGVFAVPAAGGPVRTLLAPGLVLFSHAGPGPDGRMAFVAGSGRAPEALMAHRAGRPVDEAATLFDPTPWLADRTLAATEVVRYRSFDGTEIEAVLTLPAAPPPSSGAPLLVLPHGGPDGMSLDDFSFLPQLFAAQGLLVLEPNFRGSIGGGRELYVGNRGRIGDVDYRDIMAGVDHLVAAGRADPRRLVVGGSSFGGTMTNWIVGHTDRFRAAVAVSGVSDYVSRYGTSDVNHGEPARWEFGRLPSEDLAFYQRSSPIAHLDGCATPTLLLHGELDRRVPVGQAWQMYRALRDRGVEVRLVLYPDAGHGISDPHQLRDLLTRWRDWYASHLADEAP
ncbi:MAG TPA: S9 family peptidase [Candidatus Sulfomarinibacteraceae bacterium]|nr:S9 family peptidase [Candidatus Sulfomarinibacteraceae bacterium]